jgi:hypothetical protein
VALVVLWTWYKVKLLYLDEAGDLLALPAQALTDTDQPVFVLGGIIMDYARLDALTQDFLALKKRFFPGLPYPSNLALDAVLPEIKGANIRRNAIHRSRQLRRHTLGFISHIVSLLENHHVQITARIWIKQPGGYMNRTAIYTSSVQRLYRIYDHYLTTAQDYGMCLIDSRSKFLNVPVAHSIFTQKFKNIPEYLRVIELPGFVHSDNHVGIQLSDLLCSALLSPMAAVTYCFGHIANVHVKAEHAVFKQLYGHRLKALQYRFQDSDGRWRGGISVTDLIGKRSCAHLFH